jgi:hypothetical protein
MQAKSIGRMPAVPCHKKIKAVERAWRSMQCIFTPYSLGEEQLRDYQIEGRASMFPAFTGECLLPCNNWISARPRGQVTDYRGFDGMPLLHLCPLAAVQSTTLVQASKRSSRPVNLRDVSWAVSPHRGRGWSGLKRGMRGRLPSS